MGLADIIQHGWDNLGRGDFDAIVKDYTEDMALIMPGQNDVLNGRDAFRAALDDLKMILPPGFEITKLRQLEGENEVVSILEWKSDHVAASQLSVLFKFNDNKICEERWFIDTEQWRKAF